MLRRFVMGTQGRRSRSRRDETLRIGWDELFCGYCGDASSRSLASSLPDIRRVLDWQLVNACHRAPPLRATATHASPSTLDLAADWVGTASGGRLQAGAVGLADGYYHFLALVLSSWLGLSVESTAPAVASSFL